MVTAPLCLLKNCQFLSGPSPQSRGHKAHGARVGIGLTVAHADSIGTTALGSGTNWRRSAGYSMLMDSGILWTLRGRTIVDTALHSMPVRMWP